MVDQLYNELPFGWAKTEFQNIVDSFKRGPFGSTIKKEFFVPDGFKVYEQKNAIYDDPFRGEYYINKVKYDELAAFKIKPKDFIVSCSGTIGRILILPDNPKPGIINQALLRIRIDERLISHIFFLYLFRSEMFQKLILVETRGSAMKNITGVKDLKLISITIPSLLEQNQIVAKIKELFFELDNGIESLKKAREQLKTYRQAVLKYAFEGKLTKKWRGKNKTAIWKKMKLGDLIKAKSGNGLTKVHQVDTGNHLVYGGNGIMGKHNKYMFEEPKLIIGRVGVHCGNVHITKPASWVTDNAFVINFDNDQVGMKYLLYFISDLNLKKYSNSTAQPVISGGKIYPIDVKIPEKAEQQAIVSEIESRLSVCDKIEQTIEDSLKKAEAMRQSILKKAFSGELTRDWREKHPELITGENSAEKLLEKINAEKAISASRKKPRSKKTKSKKVKIETAK